MPNSARPRSVSNPTHHQTQANPERQSHYHLHIRRTRAQIVPALRCPTSCQGLFDRRSLADAITYGKALVTPHNVRLSAYDSRAQTFLVSWIKSLQSTGLVY
ncbi:hypothetical protein BJX61DRAFT_511000 [Aspergillus egyptiacus]|nr:hypothetical protein BJX61DRAFT_511000 [Aspergillus egyptiacus]